MLLVRKGMLFVEIKKKFKNTKISLIKNKYIFFSLSHYSFHKFFFLLIDINFYLMNYVGDKKKFILLSK
jgi:hypothetical protein